MDNAVLKMCRLASSQESLSEAVKRSHLAVGFCKKVDLLMRMNHVFWHRIVKFADLMMSWNCISN